MDEAVEAVLAEYDQRGVEEFELRDHMSEDEWMSHRDDFLISIGRHTGQLLNILIKGAKARNILEIGTSYGHSTVWLAEAARATGGTVFTIDEKANKQEYARGILARAGLVAHVDFRLGDAREMIAALPGPFDFVLVDLWKDLYIPCFDLFCSKLSSGALIAADNMIWPESSREHALAYRKHIRSKPKIDSILLDVGSGIELSRYGDKLA
ncbi:MAG TPA: class I SAM-dependent methyltransferase [Candidatus Acidoferrales bacterium]|nr:class I SAM-dependent methyltransferase [Candidatus Acidoferrales bacterium]